MYKIGDIVETNNGVVTVIDYKNWRNIVVMFNTTGCIRTVCSSDLRKGLVKDIMKPTMYGVGILGKTWERGKTSSFEYKTWVSMLDRLFTKKQKESYKNVAISDDFLNFSDFESWCHTVRKEVGFQLDKDLLGDGKLYSSETCCFLPSEINIALTVKTSTNLTGVRPSGNKFFASVRTGGDAIYLGTYDTEIEAHQVYKEHKKEYMAVLAEKWKGKIDERAYDALLNYNFK